MANYLPVTEFQGEAHDYLTWSFALPPSIDAERLEINIDRLKLFHRLGGIANSVVYDYQGERSEFTPNIAGVNADGTALASKSGLAKKAEETSSKKRNLYQHPVQPIYGKFEALHGINKAELAGQVSDAVINGQHNREKVWAAEIDAALRKSLREVSHKHLVETSDPLFDRLMSSTKLVTLTSLSVIKGDPEWITLYGMSYASLVGAFSVMNSILNGGTMIKERRWSILPLNYQPDRYLAVNALSRATGLVRSRD